MNTPTYRTLTSLPLVSQGKVRDVYAINDHELLMVASDRVSAFDVILPDELPGKGILLTQIALFWFERFKHLVPNHISDTTLDSLNITAQEHEMLQGRSMIVKKLKPLPIEAIVRGYILGSGWKEYQQTQSICGIQLPQGLQQAEKLPQALFTPSSKANIDDSDINISEQQVEKEIGATYTGAIKEYSLQLYQQAAQFAEEKGIIIADTKFEFGTDADGQLFIMDEILTPDSSRFWDAKMYQVGLSPVSFDKQFVRDYLESIQWNKKAPGPKLPKDVQEKTIEKYQQVIQYLTC